jgi:hypothetical protein
MLDIFDLSGLQRDSGIDVYFAHFFTVIRPRLDKLSSVGTGRNQSGARNDEN